MPGLNWIIFERHHKKSQKSDTWKIQSPIAVNFVSSIDTDDEREMHSKSDNKEITIFYKAVVVIQQLFESLLSRY